MSSLNLSLNNNQLKIVAMVTMLLDHIGRYLFPQYVIFRIIGRISFPIFAYMIAEGCIHTKNRAKYLTGLFVLAVICQLGFFIVSGSLYMNILLTFSLSVLTIYTADFFLKRKNFSSLLVLIFEFFVVVFICVFLGKILSGTGFKIDYGLLGVMLPVAIYYTPKKYLKIIITALFISVMAIISVPLKWYALLSIPLLALYNKERGKINLKYLFYAFYPLHFVLLFIIKNLLNYGV